MILKHNKSHSHATLPCLISALRIPTFATPLTAPVFEGLATAVPREATTAPAVEVVVCGAEETQIT